jgi:DNA-binding HxlR family transcriptional regulator
MPPWVEYELSDKGQALGKALAGLEAWGRRYMDTGAATPRR